jgi:hypothetical protein
MAAFKNNMPLPVERKCMRVRKEFYKGEIERKGLPIYNFSSIRMKELTCNIRNIFARKEEVARCNF